MSLRSFSNDLNAHVLEWWREVQAMIDDEDKWKAGISQKREELDEILKIAGENHLVTFPLTYVVDRFIPREDDEDVEKSRRHARCFFKGRLQFHFSPFDGSRKAFPSRIDISIRPDNSTGEKEGHGKDIEDPSALYLTITYPPPPTWSEECKSPIMHGITGDGAAYSPYEQMRRWVQKLQGLVDHGSNRDWAEDMPKHRDDMYRLRSLNSDGSEIPYDFAIMAKSLQEAGDINTEMRTQIKETLQDIRDWELYRRNNVELLNSAIANSSSLLQDAFEQFKANGKAAEDISSPFKELTIRSLSWETTTSMKALKGFLSAANERGMAGSVSNLLRFYFGNPDKCSLNTKPTPTSQPVQIPEEILSKMSELHRMTEVGRRRMFDLAREVQLAMEEDQRTGGNKAHQMKPLLVKASQDAQRVRETLASMIQASRERAQAILDASYEGYAHACVQTE